ncbi:hypothetical protein Tco_1517632 [Tanacetum coccineum]
MYQTLEKTSLAMTRKLDDMIELPKSQPKETYMEDLECEMVMVKMPRFIAWLGSIDTCDEHIGSLGEVIHINYGVLGGKLARGTHFGANEDLLKITILRHYAISFKEDTIVLCHAISKVHKGIKGTIRVSRKDSIHRFSKYGSIYYSGSTQACCTYSKISPIRMPKTGKSKTNAEYSQIWHNGTSRGRCTETSDGLAAIQAQLNNLGREIKKVNEKAYAAQIGYLFKVEDIEQRLQGTIRGTMQTLRTKNEGNIWKIP